MAGEMTKEENIAYEKAITAQIMETYHFEWIPKNDKWVRCKACGKRLYKFYIGKAMNERMIDHYEAYHGKR